MGSLEITKSPLTSLARKLRLSATLEINELVQECLNKGQKVVHLGFGEATFPIQKDVLDVHRNASNISSYLPVAGLMSLREVSSLLVGRTNRTLIIRDSQWPNFRHAD